jgi:hypothetical protein
MWYRVTSGATQPATTMDEDHHWQQFILDLGQNGQVEDVSKSSLGSGNKLGDICKTP